MGVMRVLFLAAAAVASFANAASATGFDFNSFSDDDRITIAADHGGQIASYAMKLNQIEERNYSIKFAGKCESACTLYLSLPPEKVCVTPRASFGFHLPFGVSAHQVDIARTYLMDHYPYWVRYWIAAKGGLTPRLKVMPYNYVRHFLPDC
jgi:hypothetical protein